VTRAFHGERGSFALMLAIATSLTTAKGTVEIVYPPYFAGYGYSLSVIGVLTSLIAFAQLFTRVPAGVAYRAHRARLQYALALIVFAATTAGFAFAQGQGIVVATLSALHGFAFGALGTLGLALAIDLSGGRRAGPAMAWYTAAISTGYALGSLIGGSLAETIGMAQTLVGIAALPLLAAAAVFALPRVEAAPQAFDRGAGLRGLLAAGARLDSRVWLAVVIVLYLNVQRDALDTFFPIFGPTVGISFAVVGVLRAIKSGAGVFMRLTIAVLLHAVDYRRVTVVAVVALAAGTFVVPLTSSVIALGAIFILLGLCGGVLRATSAANIAELRAEGRDIGLASGVYNMGLDIGGIIGPALGGAVASVVGIGPMFQIVAVLSFVAWLLVALSSSTTREASGLGKRHTIGPTAVGGGEHRG
jgi:predicted MFS family arabinose efflux permease